MARSTRSSNKPQTVDRDALVAQLVAAALEQIAGTGTVGKPKANSTKPPKAERTYDLTKAATRSQVFRAFFAMAKAHHGLTFKADEWPTSGDIQSILDSLS